MSIIDLLNYIYQELQRVASLNTCDLSEEDKYLVGELYDTAQVLSYAANRYKDKALFQIADDLIYAAGHMDLALHKVESGLNDAKQKIEAYARQEWSI